jgi:hypothetical protein
LGSSSSPVELNLIRKLRPVELNFGKDLKVSSKILKGSFSAVSYAGMFLLEKGAISSLLTDRVSVVGIALALFRIIFFAIFYFKFNDTSYFKYNFWPNVVAATVVAKK